MENEIKKIDGCKAEVKLIAKWNDIEADYDKELLKYQKQLTLPGFRKGKAPKAVVEKKIGDSLFNDVCFEVMNKTLTKLFEDADPKLRPLPYSRPDVVDIDKIMPFARNKDIEFTVQYEIMPDIPVKEYKGIKGEYPNVIISEQMVDNEVERYRNQNAMVKKKESGIIEKGDLVTVDYINLDSDKEDAKVDDYTFTVGNKTGYYKFDDEVIGMKDGETKEFTMNYKDDDRPTGLEVSSVRMKVSVKSVKVRELPDVDDEFAQDIKSEYKTVADMRAGIRKTLEDSLNERMKDTKIKVITDKILEGIDVTVPKTMVDFEIETAFRRTASQYGATPESFVKFLESVGQSKESFTSGWRADAEQNLKSQLVINKVQELENIKAEEEKVKAVLDKEIPADAKVEDKKRFEESVRDNMAYNATIDFLIENSAIKPSKKEISYEDYVSGAYLREAEGKKSDENESEKKETKKSKDSDAGSAKPKTVRKTAATKKGESK